LLALPAKATISVVAHQCYSLGANGGTTTALNISGATNVAIGVVYYTGGTFTSLVDSPGDALNARTAQTTTEPVIRAYDFDFGSAISYTTYTVTVNGTSVFASVCITAWSGGKSSASFDAQDGNFTNGAASVTAGSGITPSQAGEILTTFLGIGPGSNTPTVNSSFGTPDCISYTGGVTEGICQASQVQTTATFRQPQWSWVTSTQGAITMDAYKPAPTGGTVTPRMTLLGVAP